MKTLATYGQNPSDGFEPDLAKVPTNRLDPRTLDPGSGNDPDLGGRGD